jgi:phosphorylase kinase alpha/beta subunit
MSRDWATRPVETWLDGALTSEDVDDLIGFLTERGTFEFPTLPTGLFSAAAGEGEDFEVSGYRNVWVRDNMQIAWAYLAVQRAPEVALRCVGAVTEFYRRHRHRFVNVIEGRVDFQNPMNRPHVRFNGADLTELSEKWSHAQNDALGYFLWMSCRLIREQLISSADAAWDIFSLLVHYWDRIEVWKDEDSGHWEESRKVAASSIGTVLAGLRELRGLLDTVALPHHLETQPLPLTSEVLDSVIDRCECALWDILPSECVQTDSLKCRRYDAALLFLIYPLAVIGDRAMENQILADVRGQLQGPWGIRRYPGDSYWCADYRDLLSADQRTADFSDSLGARDQLLRPGMEAQWCIFDPIVSCIYGRRYQESGDPEDLRQQRQHVQRSLAQMTRAGGRFPPYRCPESWFCEKGEWIPNDITPLLWTQGNLLQALTLLSLNLKAH